jgi:hypothetical protein
LRTSRLFPALIAVCAILAGSAPIAQTKLTMAGYPAPGAPAAITVVSTGAGTKKALRYVVPAGHKARMDMTMTMGMAMNIGGMAMPMDMPPMKLTADLGVTTVAPDGDITYTVAFTGLTLDEAGGGNPAIAAALQSAAAGITSMKATSTISSRGLTRSTKLEVSDPTMQQLLGQMTSSIENLSNPFPEEPVGPGARWEVRQALTSGGQTSFLKTEYELVSIEGNAVTLKTKSEQTAPAQSVSNPALPAGREKSHEKQSGSGTGTLIIRLDSLVPNAEMNSTISTSMVMSMGGMTQPVASDMKLKIVIAPGKVK